MGAVPKNPIHQNGLSNSPVRLGESMQRNREIGNPSAKLGRAVCCATYTIAGRYRIA